MLVVGVIAFAAISVSVSRDEGSALCPDAAAVVAAATRTKADAFMEAEEGADVSVSIAKQGEKYFARIRTREGRERTLLDDDATCRGLREALPTILAVMDRGEKGAGDKEESKVEVSPAPVEESRRTDRTGSLGLGAGAHLGLSRDVGFLATVDGTLMVGPTFALLARLHFAPKSDLAVGKGSVGITWAAAEIGGCVRAVEAKSVSLLPCASLVGGFFAANGQGFTSNTSALRPLLGAALGVRAELFRPVGLFVHASLIFPFNPEAFAVDNVGIAYDPGRVGAALGAGFVFSNPPQPKKP